MIAVKDIVFKYPKKTGFALRDVTLTVESGEIFTLLGPNGAGKTTLIRILAGLILPRSGSVVVNGYDINRDEYSARKSIGLVLGDERTFYFRLSGRQNLEFFGGLYGVRRSVLKQRIQNALETVGLQDAAGLQYMRYSTGMRKRLNMARALLHNPDVLLLDEPNSGIDPHSARKIREVVFAAKQAGKTVLMTTHDMEEADRMSDTIGFLKEGSLIKIGDSNEFKSMINKQSLDIEFADKIDSHETTAIETVIQEIRKAVSCEVVYQKNGSMRIQHNGSFAINTVLDIITRHKHVIRKINTTEATLEDVFIKLAG